MKTYRTRNPRKSPVWQCVQRHRDTLVDRCPDAHEFRLGPLRPVVTEVFGQLLQCGILELGFARKTTTHSLSGSPRSGRSGFDRHHGPDAHAMRLRG